MITSLYTDYTNGIIQECDFKSMYNQEIEKRNKINEDIKRANRQISNQNCVTETEFRRVVKKVSDIKKWSKEQISDVIESVQIDNEDNIFINYKYDIMEMA